MKEKAITISGEENQNAPIQSAIVEIVKRTDIEPERLEKFLEIQIKMEDRQNKQAFQKALSLFQNECPIIKQTKHVKFKAVDYHYAPLDEIVFIIKPILAKYGLSYSFNVEATDGNLNILLTTIHHESGYEKVFSHFFNPLHDDNRMNESQRSKSAITFAKRAAIENALGIVTAGEDDDARRCIDTVISDKQIEAIESLMISTKTEEERFFGFMQINELKELSSLEADKAIHVLKQKRIHNVRSNKL